MDEIKPFKRTDARIRPDVCPNCGTLPTICPTDGEYQCRCPVPWLIRLPKKTRPKIIPRVHYDPMGQPYQARFIDGYIDEDYPSASADDAWLIEGGLT